MRPYLFGTYTLFQRKAAIVERLNRTLKGMMWKYFLKNNTHEWIHILDDITHNYNNSVNRVLKPNEVDKSNADQVWLTLYGENVLSLPPEPKFSIGDIIRVEKYYPETRHTKGYTINFTEEEFRIIGVYRSNPIMYIVQDMGTGEKITGRFYERELSVVKKSLPEQGPEKIE